MMRTFSGRLINLADFRPEFVDIRDIAHSLAHLCRFNGHCPVHYSVAQHSCHVANVVKGTHPQFELLALLHDAAEAYVGDMTRPLKAVVGDAFTSIEQRISQVIYRSLANLEVPPAASQVIAAADEAVLQTELQRLFAAPASETPQAIPKARFDVWTTRWAESRFLKRFEELTNK